MLTPLPVSLPPEQHRVLALVAQGHSNAAITLKLELGEGTVANYLKQIYAALGVDRAPGVDRRVMAALCFQSCPITVNHRRKTRPRQRATMRQIAEPQHPVLGRIVASRMRRHSEVV